MSVRVVQCVASPEEKGLTRRQREYEISRVVRFVELVLLKGNAPSKRGFLGEILVLSSGIAAVNTAVPRYKHNP